MRIARRLGPLVMLAFASGALAHASACGGSSDGEGPPPLGTGSAPRDAGPRDAGAPATPFDAGVEASAGATTYRGKLARTLPVKFGGAPFCEYTITLEQIEVEIAALDNGDLVSATVKDLAIEGTVPPCPHPPIAPTLHTFALTTTTKTASGLTLAFEGAKSNKPVTSLVVDLARVGVTYEASLGWKRTDQGPPFDWLVTAKMTLASAE